MTALMTTPIILTIRAIAESIIAILLIFSVSFSRASRSRKCLYSRTAEYIVKYLEKDGGRLICSRGLDTFIETKIDEEDIITALHPNEPYDDRKYILFDDFKVWDKNGICLGAFNRSLLPQLKLVS